MLAVTLVLSVPAAQAEGHLSEREGARLSAVPSSSYRVDADAPRSEKCPAARRALRWYQRHEREWRVKMGAAVGSGGERRAESAGNPLACPRYLAKRWRDKARAARARFASWHDFHWNWRKWLPVVWVRIASCETHLNWRHNSGTYQGAFGFHYDSWDRFVPYASRRARPYPGDAFDATPRQQYEVALAIYRQVGFSGWGCA